MLCNTFPLKMSVDARKIHLYWIISIMLHVLAMLLIVTSQC